MTSVQRAFITAIIATPEDDLPRLVYADYLDEIDEPESVPCRGCADGPPDEGDEPDPRDVSCRLCGAREYIYRPGANAQRAEFIRLQCEIAKWSCEYSPGPPHNGWHHDCGTEADGFWSCSRAKWRENNLWDKNKTRWFGDSKSGILNLGRPTEDHDAFDAMGLQSFVCRGFIAEVRCTLAQWIGGECATCAGSGLSEREYHGVTDDDGGCYDCKGTGRTEGIGPQLCAENPVERVEITDKEPDDFGSVFTWLCADEESGSQSFLPKELFDLLDGYEDSHHEEWVRYKTLDEAKAALSRAMILWARIRLAATAKAEELKGKRPWRECWYDGEVYSGKDDPESNLPPAIFALLNGYIGPGDGGNILYADEADANAALQRAIGVWAKNHVLNAGKPVLQRLFDRAFGIA